MALPGVLASRKSVSRNTRLSGTNALSTTMVLLPVPRMPAVNQVSRTVYSPGGTRKNFHSGAGPSCVMPPSMTQEQ